MNWWSLRRECRGRARYGPRRWVCWLPHHISLGSVVKFHLEPKGFFKRLCCQRLNFWRRCHPCRGRGSRQGQRVWQLGELRDVRNDCFKHSCYGLNLVGEPLERFRGHRRAPEVERGRSYPENQLSETRNSGKAREVCSAWDVAVVKGLVPQYVVGLLQEKTFVGGEPPNEVPPMTKSRAILALSLYDLSWSPRHDGDYTVLDDAMRWVSASVAACHPRVVGKAGGSTQEKYDCLYRLEGGAHPNTH
ncbi:hypothetical protein GW17_00037075 [Ensete ventricosum]|nr:hypothetical protein GW17_00037075 [Ensete ventricosum]